MTKSELYYVAGLLEGEGCFTPDRNRRQNAVYPVIQVTSTDLDVLETLRSTCGGRIGGPNKVRKATHRPTYVWVLRGPDAVSLMRKVYPLMHERRQAQIDAAFDEFLPHISSVPRVNGNGLNRYRNYWKESA